MGLFLSGNKHIGAYFQKSKSVSNLVHLANSRTTNHESTRNRKLHLSFELLSLLSLRFISYLLLETGKGNISSLFFSISVLSVSIGKVRKLKISGKRHLVVPN